MILRRVADGSPEIRRRGPVRSHDWKTKIIYIVRNSKAIWKERGS